MFALIFWPHVTIFYIFWLHECLKWRLEFNSKSLFWYQSRQIFKVRAIEQRHHEFQLIHMPPHKFWPQYHSDGLSPVHVRFEFFSKQICNVEALICHFYKNIKTLTQIHFPRDAHIFRTCTIFYRHYKGLHQMRKDLVLCAHMWVQKKCTITDTTKPIAGIDFVSAGPPKKWTFWTQKVDFEPHFP